MDDIKGGDSLNYDVYYVKERKVSEKPNPDGTVSKVTHVEGKIVFNPSQEYINSDSVEVVSKRRIIVQVMEVNVVGGKVANKGYLFGIRIIDNGKVSPVFHLLVRDSKEFRERVKKEIEYYLRVMHLLNV